MRVSPKVLLYAHDTYGLGHLRRNLAIARHLLETVPGIQVLLATGSVVANRFDKPAGLQIIELPPVIKTGDEQYSAREPGIPISLVRKARSAVLVDVVTRWQPDIMLVDHSPQGMKGELLPVFEALASHCPQTKVVLGLRDILDDPARVQELWSDQGVYATLEHIYHKILVYGNPDVTNVVQAYGLSDTVSAKLTYCGYVASASPLKATPPPQFASNQPYVLGTVGGGGDGADVMIATIRAADQLAITAVIACGPLMSAQDRAKIDAAADSVPAAVVVEMFADLAAVGLGAQCIVTRGGYNSLCELAPLGVPTIVVPRIWPRKEQLIRARAFAKRGLVEVVEAPSEELDNRLVGAIRNAIASRSGNNAPNPLDLGGLSKIRKALLEILESEPGTNSQHRPMALPGAIR